MVYRSADCGVGEWTGSRLRIIVAKLCQDLVFFLRIKALLLLVRSHTFRVRSGARRHDREDFSLVSRLIRIY